MRKTWNTVLLFVLVLAVLLGIWQLWQWVCPQETEQTETETDTPPVIANTLDEEGASVVTLSDEGISLSGLGVTASGSVVTISYPGTYRVSGQLSQGQLVVDCGDFDGGVYIILDNASITCPDGPALYVKQADKTVVYLPDGTMNALQDGSDYRIDEGKNTERGAGIYSADDLEVCGDGHLAVTGMSADGIRSKDGLTISGGQITVYAADEALQGSDYVDITGGSLNLHANGDGIATKKGDVTIAGGEISIASAGDGISSAAALTMTAGSVNIVTYGGADNYDLAAAQDISAKGLKAVDIAITGGDLQLNTAEDGIHGQKTVSISDSQVAVQAGDDGIHAALSLDISGGVVNVSQSYEAVEAERVTMDDGLVTLDGTHKGIDAGEDGFVMTGGTVWVSAPRCLNADGGLTVADGYITLVSDGSDAPIKCSQGTVTGGTLVLCTVGDEPSVLEKAHIDPALLFTMPQQTEGQSITIADTQGNTLLSLVPSQTVTAVLYASGALCAGQNYTLTAGDYTATLCLTTDGDTE
jgi:hypothetical protein